MGRALIRATRTVLPLAFGVAAAAVRIIGGARLDLPALLLFCGGLLLGWAAVWLLEGMALMVGHMTAEHTPREQVQARLERDKELLLRAIKEIEFEAALQKLPAAEAEHLAAPLRGKALDVLRSLDLASQGQGPLSLEQQIELEVARRAAGEGSR